MIISVLLERGYKCKTLIETKRLIWQSYDVIVRRDKEDEERSIIPVITYYERFHSRLNKKWCHTIRANSILNEARIISAFKRHKNLKDYSVKGQFGEPYTQQELQNTDDLLDLLIMVMEADRNK